MSVSPSLVGDALGFIFRLPSFLPPYLQVYYAKEGAEEHISNGPHLFAVYVFTRYIKGFGKDMVVNLLDGRETSRNYYFPFMHLLPNRLSELIAVYETLSSIGMGKEYWLNTISVADAAPLAAALNWIQHYDNYDNRDLARIATYLSFMERTGCSISEAAEKIENPEVKRIVLEALDFKKRFNAFAPLDYLVEAYKASGLTDLGASEDMKENYEKYSEALSKIIKDKRVLFPKNLSVSLLFVNFGSVESYLSSFWRLRDYAASSALVDIMVSSLAFSALDKLVEGYLPHEVLVIQHGGHSDILFPAQSIDPSQLRDYVRKTLKQLWDSFRARIEISSDYFIYQGAINFSHDDLISSSKFENMASFEPRVFSYGLHKVCENCGAFPAVERVGDEYLCEACSRVRRFSDYHSLGKKIKSSFVLPLERELTLNPENYQGEDPMGYIGRAGYVTVAKFDGNDMGNYFRSADLISYASKSYFIYWSVMKAYSQTVKKIKEECSEKIAHMIVSGTIYLAGDEGVIILPPRVAPRFLVEFARNADRVNLKAGVLTVKAEHPFSVTVEVCERLMNDSKVQDRNETTIGYMIAESGITPNSYSSVFGQGSDESPGIKAGSVYRLLYDQKVSAKKLEELLNVIGFSCQENAGSQDYKLFLRKLANSLEGAIESGSQEMIRLQTRGDPEAFDGMMLLLFRTAFRNSDARIRDTLHYVLAEAIRDYYGRSEKQGEKPRLNLLWYLYVIKSMMRGE